MGGMTMGFAYGLETGPLLDAIKKLPQAISGKVVADGARAGAVVIQQEMVKRAPVRGDGFKKKISKKSDKRRGPGYLKKNIVTQKFMTSPTRATYSAGIKQNFFKGKSRGAFYAYYLEYGTKNMSAHPFLRAAYRAVRQQALNTMVGTLDKAIVRECRKMRKSVKVKYLTRGR